MLQIIMLMSLVVSFEHCHALNIERTTTKVLAPGIAYATYSSPDIPLRIWVITVQLSSVQLQLQLARGQREEASSIARRTGAFIAVNGCNYRRGGRYNGNRVNLLYCNDTIYSDLRLARGCFLWNNHTKQAKIKTVALQALLTINGVKVPVDGINQPRAAHQAVLYNDVADISLLGHTPGVQIIIDDTRSVVEVRRTIPTKIPIGWHVYQTSDTSVEVRPGDAVQLSLTFHTPIEQIFEHEYDCIIGGAGLLIQNHEIVADRLYQEFSQGNAIVHCHDEVAADFHMLEMQKWMIELRHPRTAIGLLDNETLCFVVVDGRHETSVGLSLHELAAFMHRLGCRDALNIGGGGCTTLYIDNILFNNPSGEIGNRRWNEERPVSEAFCIYL